MRSGEAEESHGVEVAARLRRHVEMLAGTIGPRNLAYPSAYEAAREYVRQELESCGLRVRALPYKCARHEVVNLEARLPGQREDLPPVVVGAHYDTCGDTPGADDNASAVAGLIEIARELTGASAHPSAPQRTRGELGIEVAARSSAGDPTRRFAQSRRGALPCRPIRFVVFANEEPPFFMTEQMGSLVYARSCRSRGEKLLGMLCLEMIGYFLTESGSQPYPPELPAPLRKTLPSRGDFIVLISDTGSSRFTYRLRRKIGFGAQPDKSLPKLPIFAFGLPPAFTGGAHMLSDHWSFRQAGYQATMATDTAMVRNPHYHLPSDRPETLDYPRMAQLVLRLSRGLRRV